MASAIPDLEWAVGEVKWFDCKKGFGFLVHHDGQDVFVHYSVIEGEGFRRLRDGEQVEYVVVYGPKGLTAARVRPIAQEHGQRGLWSTGHGTTRL